MQTKPLLLFLSALGCLSMASCGGNNEDVKVKLSFGTMIGLEDKVSVTSHLKWIKKSELNKLVSAEDDFVLLLHGSADTCTCYTDWHENVLVPYIKRTKLLVYAIDLTEFESDGEYMGLKRIQGSETLAIFERGKVRYQHSTDNESEGFVTKASDFAAWMDQRCTRPKIFYVDKDILDGFYAGNSPFTIYFGRDLCPDCSYLRYGILRDYLENNDVVDKSLFYIDFDAYRPTRGAEDYDEKMVVYNELKAEYGLAWSEDNPAGYGTGAFPSIFYVNPDGASHNGDIIEAAGVFFNETIDEKTGVISNSYFSKERYDEASSSYMTYLKDANLAKPYFDGEVAPEGENRHDRLLGFTKPIFTALMDYCVKA